MTDGRIRGVRTNKGNIQAEVVVIACGIWSPRIARMAGASIPLTPAVHQMISVGPVPLFAGTVGEIKYPIVRDVDTNMYERQHGGDLEVGSYAHRPILWDPDEIPSIEASALSPTETPFTKEDFDPQMEQALELIPDILGDERVGVRYAINGLLSLTPDGFPCLGETPEVKGLWSVAAVWIKEAPGIARTVAEWMTTGGPEIDPTGSDIARFYHHQRTPAHVQARSAEGYNKTYGIVHPREQWASNRDVRLSPFYAREKALGAVFFETAGWERPNWYESNRPLLEKYGDRVMARRRVGGALVVADHQRRAPGHARARGHGGPERLCRLRRGRAGRAALHAAPWRSARWMCPRARGLHLAAERAWRHQGRPDHHAAGRQQVPRGHRRLRRHARPEMADRPPARGRLGGDQRPDLGLVHPGRVGAARARSAANRHRGRRLECRLPVRHLPANRHRPGAAVLASRISYVGELGWELYAPMEQGQRLWDIVWEAGQKFGLVPVGIGVYATTARLEKGYRAYGAELELEYNLMEAGMQRPQVKPQAFIGREAYLRQRAEPRRRSCAR